MEYLLTAAVLVAMTVTPLPLPPSWLVLAYLSVELDANVAGIVVAGAVGAATGRTVLAAWTPLFLFFFLGTSVLFYTEA